jgi:ABC-2 type transport system ATP-binding protein
MSAETASPGHEPLGIACNDVSMRYGKTLALDRLGLRVEPGTALGLVGRNGAGKSTLFRVLLGIERPTSGNVEMLPYAMPRERFLARTGFVPDHLSAYDWMTVGSAIEYVASLQPFFDRAWSDELVRDLGLDRSKKLKALSRGMQARLAFVLGLSHRPGLVILDEPLLGVDAVSHDSILSMVARLRDELESTVIIASHALGDLARLTDRVAFIDRGRIVEELATDDLVAGTKRLVLTPRPAAFAPPPEAVHVAQRDDALVVTVRNFTNELFDRMRALVPGARVDVVDLTIAEACADRMRAMEVTA